MKHSHLRVALVTNIPAPYRQPVLEYVAEEPDINFCAFFCSDREPDREWNLDNSKFKQVFLRDKFFIYRDRFIHMNPDIWSNLGTFRPNVVITTGFNPTHLLAFMYARLHGAKHLTMTDGTYQSEAKLSFIHRWVRKFIFSGSQAFIGASNGSFMLYRSYGVDLKRLFKSQLCADNVAFSKVLQIEKQFDFIFCGRFVQSKNPLFTVDLAHEVSRCLRRRVSVLFVGSGELEPAIRYAATNVKNNVESVFAGFVRQDELPCLYASARIFLFPTKMDTWGVVVNEACAAGLPVLVSPFAGSAYELVRHGENGFVLPLNIQQWTEASINLLNDSYLYSSMSTKSLELVKDYNFKNAAGGIIDAIRMVHF